MELIHLSLGSNLGDRLKWLNKARYHLRNINIKNFNYSLIFESNPLIYNDQPKYLNQVINGYTELSPENLLSECNKIELRLGRVRKKHWDSRTIDIDILSYGSKIIKTKELTIPHPEIVKRGFVLIPLKNLSPKWTHPLMGLSIDKLLYKWNKINKEPLPQIFC